MKVKETLIKCGFKPMVCRESIYYHKEKQLFLSVNVDDFRMAGKKENLKPMWELLQKHLTLDPPTPISGGVYLGVNQHSIEPPEDMIKAINALYHDLLTKKIMI